MAEAAVTDFESSFGDVATAAAEQFGGAFHADLLEVLLDGHARFLGELATQIEGTATDHTTEFIQGRGTVEALPEDFARSFDALAGRALRPGAKQFASRGAEEELGGEFQCLAAKPDFLRGLEHRASTQAFDELQEGDADRFRVGDLRHARFALDDGGDDGVKIFRLGGELFAQEVGRKFDGDEPVMFVGPAGRAKRRLSLVIEEQRALRQFHRATGPFQIGRAFEVQTKLEAIGVETAAPIQGFRALKVMPFETKAQLVEAAEQWTPAGADALPGARFTKGGSLPARKFRRSSGCGAFQRGAHPHSLPSSCVLSTVRFVKTALTPVGQTSWSAGQRGLPAPFFNLLFVLQSNGQGR